MNFFRKKGQEWSRMRDDKPLSRFIELNVSSTCASPCQLLISVIGCLVEYYSLASVTVGLAPKFIMSSFHNILCKNPNKLLGQPNTRVPAFLCSVYHCDHELFLKFFPPSTCLVSCPLAARYFAFLSSSAHPGITAGLPPTPNTSQEN